MGPPARFDLFEQQPASPTHRHDDLPAEFGDRSFGSSMSLGSSFDLGIGRLPTTGSSTTISALAPLSILPLPASSSSSSSASSSTSSSSLLSAKHGVHSSPSPPRVLGGSAVVKRSSPTTTRKLGAAMGTELNGKSPGLAAKLSSPHYMDISPAPAKTPLDAVSAGTSAYRPAHTSMRTPVGVFQPPSVPSSCLPPGSAMKEDTPSVSGRRTSRISSSSRQGSRASSRGNSRASSRASSRSNSPDDASAAAPHGVPGGSLGRLFGTCLSVNSVGPQRDSEEASASGNTLDPDNSFEMPAPKRRPSSLPMGEGRPPPRPSLRNAGLLPTMRKNSGSLMSSFRDDDTARRRTSQEVARRRMHRSSEPSLGPVAPPSRQMSTEQGDSSNVLPNSFSAASAASSSSTTSSAAAKTLFGARCRERADYMGLAAMATHKTIIESPSPGTFEKQDLGSYFFDPQSPDTSLQGIVVNAAPSVRAVPTHLAQRPGILKAHTQVEGLTCKRKADQRKGSAQGLGAALPTRPALRPIGLYVKSSEALLSGSEVASALERQKAPAPRRAISNFDAPSTSMLPDSSSRESINMLDGPSPSPAGGRRFPDGFDADGSPIAPSNKRNGLFRRPSKDDSSPLVHNAHRYRACQQASLSGEGDDDELPASTSFGAECMPGFGASERSGKILPCFNVKEDGLMRITPETLVALLQGKYNSQLESYQVVDCRFGYEFEGGHIPGAINLSTVERVKDRFLSPSAANLPPRSQSGKADAYGNSRKPILVFHCEFSAKRAPSMALALRQADRGLQQDYPNCHYPEVYILQGGYSGFFQSFPSVCEPQAYVRMDDPTYQDQRSSELNGFRKQFARHRSFTYGESRKAEATLAASRPASGFIRGLRAATMICEESAESSFEQDSSPSNMAATKKQLREGEVDDRGEGEGALPPSSSFGDTSVDSDTGLPLASRAGAARGPADISPCAHVAHNQYQHTMPFRKSSLGPSASPSASRPLAPPVHASRRPFLRAGTTGGFLHSGRA
ncbi:unnamed protein product [Parajaminaea phylloscopi]